jgi:diguanylate cyclase (GGDEF)-like protein
MSAEDRISTDIDDPSECSDLALIVKFSITHVLLVEDWPHVRRGIAEICRSITGMPIDVVEAASLAEATRAADRCRIDVVLLDSTLPEGSCPALIEEARSIFTDVPLIVLGDEDGGEAPRSISLGAQDYLPKEALTAPLLERAIRYAMERHTLLAELRRLSLTDELTSLYNRRGFFTLGEQSLRAARRAGQTVLLLYLDVDGLKRTNDVFGHEAGDRLLRDAGLVLEETFREADVLARIGGDEFAVLGVSEDAARPEERLLRNVRRRNEKSRGRPLHLSAGAVLAEPDAGLGLGDLLSRADAEMYRRRTSSRSGAAALRSSD